VFITNDNISQVINVPKLFFRKLNGRTRIGKIIVGGRSKVKNKERSYFPILYRRGQ